MKLCESHPAVDRLGFQDFLAKPLQRLTKYPLLLKGILHNTSKKRADEVKALESCIEKSASVLRYVQEAVKESEDRARLKELNDKLDKSALSAEEEVLVRDLHLSGRKLLLESDLQMRCQDKLVDVHAILLSDLFLICVQGKDGSIAIKV